MGPNKSTKSNLNSKVVDVFFPLPCSMRELIDIPHNPISNSNRRLIPFIKKRANYFKNKLAARNRM